jgi:hypothetical protein
MIRMFTSTAGRVITTGRIVRTDRIVLSGRNDRPLYLHKDQGEAWVVPPCREVVAVVAVAAVAAASIGLV